MSKEIQDLPYNDYEAMTKAGHVLLVTDSKKPGGRSIIQWQTTGFWRNCQKLSGDQDSLPDREQLTALQRTRPIAPDELEEWRRIVKKDGKAPAFIDYTGYRNRKDKETADEMAALRAENERLKSSLEGKEQIAEPEPEKVKSKPGPKPRSEGGEA